MNPSLGFMAFTMFLLFIVCIILVSAGVVPHLLETRIYDVTAGCVLALAAVYPRFSRAST